MIQNLVWKLKKCIINCKGTLIKKPDKLFKTNEGISK